MKRGAVLVNVARGSLVDRSPRSRPPSRTAGSRARRSTSSSPSRPIRPIRSSGFRTSSRRRTSAPRRSRRRSASRSRRSRRCSRPSPARPTFRRSTCRFADPRMPEGAAGWMRLAERTAHFLSAAGRRPTLAPGGRDVGPSRGHAAAGGGRGRQGRAREAHARDRQLRQRPLPGPGPRRCRSPRRATRIRAPTPDRCA